MCFATTSFLLPAADVCSQSFCGYKVYEYLFVSEPDDSSIT